MNTWSGKINVSWDGPVAEATEDEGFWDLWDLDYEASEGK